MSAVSGAPAPAVQPAAEPRRRPGRALFLAGLVSRTWLWFVAGCLAITLLPILFGWRPFVIESGSMQPRIDIGDVVLASPVDNANDLLGRVAVFQDPDRPGTMKSHRIVAINADGTLTSKGDANPTVDSLHVPLSDVRGLGRLLVGFAGLPLIWTQNGQWLLLLGFLLSLLVAATVVSRDRDPEEADDGDESDDPGPGMGAVIPLPTRGSGGGSTTIAASRPLDPGLIRQVTPSPDPHMRRRAFLASLLGRRGVLRAGYAVVMAGALVVPTAGASFAATTKNTASTWSVGNWNYTSTVTALNPWLFWKLDETTGTTAADTTGNGRTGTYNPNAAAFTRGVAGALTTDTPNLAVTLNGTTSCINTTSTTTMTAPTQITEIVWFKTTTTAGGKLVGFEMPRTGVGVAGAGGTYDRHLYMDGAGKVWFGVYNGGYFTIGSPTSLNDGAWHQAASSMGVGGMTLYIDGTSVGTNANAVGESTTGWFRAGCGNLAGWGGSWTGGNNPTTSAATTADRPFAGSLDEISVWQSVLTAAQIKSIFIAH